MDASTSKTPKLRRPHWRRPWVLEVAVCVVAFVGLAVWAGFGPVSVQHPAIEGGPAGPPVAQGPAPSLGRQRLRVGFFNIHRGVGLDGRRDLDRQAALLRGARLDLVGLCEVGANLGGNQCASLAQRLEGVGLFGPSEFTWGHATFGNGLVTTLPVRHWSSQPLRPSTAGRSSAYLIAEVEMGHTSVNCMVAHAENWGCRDAQLEVVVARFRSLPPPAILIGDLNAHLDHPILRDAWGGLPIVEAIQERHPALPLDRIDHLYVHGLRVVDAGITETGSSDHHLVWTELELPQAAEVRVADARE